MFLAALAAPDHEQASGRIVDDDRGQGDDQIGYVKFPEARIEQQRWPRMLPSDCGCWQ